MSLTSDGYKLADITVTRAQLYDLHGCYLIMKLVGIDYTLILHLNLATGMG